MENELKADIKCGRCKTYRYLTDFLNDKNRTMKTCKKCREYSKNRNKCPHNKIKASCVECSPCPHNKIKYSCAECNPCPHNKLKENCAECNPCPHKKIKWKCVECSPCPHSKVKYDCVECNPCPHKKIKRKCVECNPCPHKKIKKNCKKCNEPIKITISNMINHSKTNDKKYDRYDANNFIDKCFLEGLVEEYPNCYYEDCQIELQYVKYQDDLATIERLDNNIGHIKSNCVICCLKCNNMKKSNK
jgi:hypothetical protein